MAHLPRPVRSDPALVRSEEKGEEAAQARAEAAARVGLGDRQTHLIAAIRYLDSNSVKVALAFLGFAGADGTCWPSRKTIESICGVSAATAKRSIKVLTDIGILRSTGRWRHRCSVREVCPDAKPGEFRDLHKACASRFETQRAAGDKSATEPPATWIETEPCPQDDETTWLTPEPRPESEVTTRLTSEPCADPTRLSPEPCRIVDGPQIDPTWLTAMSHVDRDMAQLRAPNTPPEEHTPQTRVLPRPSFLRGRAPIRAVEVGGSSAQGGPEPEQIQELPGGLPIAGQLRAMGLDPEMADRLASRCEANGIAREQVEAIARQAIADSSIGFAAGLTRGRVVALCQDAEAKFFAARKADPIETGPTLFGEASTTDGEKPSPAAPGSPESDVFTRLESYGLHGNASLLEHSRAYCQSGGTLDDLARLRRKAGTGKNPAALLHSWISSAKWRDVLLDIDEHQKLKTIKARNRAAAQ